MSWSVVGIGKVSALAAQLERDFERDGKCSEPEESIRQSARALIAQALSAQNSKTLVKVQASGAQSSQYAKNSSEVVGYTNQLSILIEPQFNFVE